MNKLELDKQFDIKIVDKWQAPEENGAPLLTMHNIPLPLHNLAPRTIMRPKDWNIMRKACYENADYKCEICGKDLSEGGYNAHEVYDIDYTTQTTTFKRCVCLCSHPCHLDCIHTGRALTLFENGDKYTTLDQLLAGAEHAFTIISEYNKAHPEAEPLRAWQTWLDYLNNPILEKPMRELIEKYDIKFNRITTKWFKQKYWGNWKLIYDGEEYPTLFPTQKDWEEAMKKNNKKQKEIKEKWVEPRITEEETKKILENWS